MNFLTSICIIGIIVFNIGIGELVSMELHIPGAIVLTLSAMIINFGLFAILLGEAQK